MSRGSELTSGTGLHELFRTRCEYVPVRLAAAVPAADSPEKLIQTCWRYYIE